MAESGRSVTSVELIDRVRSHFGVASWEDLHVGRPRDVTVLREIMEVENKVCTFITAYVAIRSVQTLHELVQDLCIFESVQSYECLGLGPPSNLLRHPLIIRYFSPPRQLLAIPPITTYDLLVHLNNFINLHPTARVEVLDLLRFVASSRVVRDPLELCVRITGLGVAVSAVAKVRRLEFQTLRAAEAALQRTIAAQAATVQPPRAPSPPAHPAPTAAAGAALVTPGPEGKGEGSTASAAWCPNRQPVHEYVSRWREAVTLMQESQTAWSSVPAEAADSGELLVGRVFGDVEMNVEHMGPCVEFLFKVHSHLGKRYRNAAGEMLCAVAAAWITTTRPHPSKQGTVPPAAAVPLSTASDVPPSAAPAQPRDAPSGASAGGEESDEGSDDEEAAPVAQVGISAHGAFPADEASFLSMWSKYVDKNGMSAQDICQLIYASYQRLPKKVRRKANNILFKVLVRYLTPEWSRASSDLTLNHLRQQLLSLRLTLRSDFAAGALTPMRLAQLQRSLPHFHQMADAAGVTTSSFLDFVADECSSQQSGSATDAARSTVSAEAVLQFLPTAVDALTPLPDSSPPQRLLAVLCDLEAAVTAQWHAPSFASLNLGSFLSFLAQHLSSLPPPLVALLQPPPHAAASNPVHALVSRDEMDAFASQYASAAAVIKTRSASPSLPSTPELPQHPAAAAAAATSSLSTPSAVAQALCRQFCLASVDLPLPDTAPVSASSAATSQPHRVVFAEALTLDRMSMSSGDPQSVAANVARATVGSGLGGCGQSTSTAVGCVDKAHLVAFLLKAPLLHDLAAWSNWSLAFHASHGPLTQFLLSLDPNDVPAAASLRVLHVSPSLLLRIPAHASPSSIALAVVQPSPCACPVPPPIHTAALLVAVITDHASIAASPLALLRSVLSSSLESLHDEAAVSFALELLCAVPHPLRGPLAEHVVLPALSHVVRNAPEMLLRGCRGWQERAVLQGLGVALLVPPLLHDLHDALRSDAPQPKPNRTSDGRSRKRAIAETVSAPSSTPALERNAGGLGVGQPMVCEDAGGRGIGEADDAERDHEATSTPKRLRLSVDAAAAAAGEVDASDACKAVVDDIRRNDFGIGAELGAEAQRIVVVQQARLGRALQRLSTELYAKDVHFVLELVQNADDNAYAPHVNPTLEFVIAPRCIHVLNNETGFHADNIRALCDIGRSTKARAHGYIGAKGIGFKSVFRVSDRPEVHSNGFHIRFDLTTGPMGYIVPHWVDPPHAPPPLPSTSPCSFPTRIVLPLKEGSLGENAGEALAGKFEDVSPSLLLFLRRLRTIAITDAQRNTSTVMVRRDVGEGVVEIQDDSGAESWLLVKQTLVPKVAREGVDSTELVLAFPLSRLQADECGPLAQQNVFAFLPIRAYGFKFIVQGDFVVPSSREDVDRDSAWNQCLRAELPALFIASLHAFLAHFKGEEAKAASLFFRVVPLAGEVVGFFACVPAGIVSGLLSTRCMLAADGTWVLPSQALQEPPSSLQRLVDSEAVLSLLGMRFVHPSVRLPAPIARALGIAPLSASHLLRLLDAAHAASHALLSCPRFLASSLALLYHLLPPATTAASPTIQHLRLLPVIPLASSPSRVISAASAGGPVFFPLSSAAPNDVLPPATETDLLCVSRSVLASLDEVGNSMVHAMLCLLGVRDIHPHHVVTLHLVPSLTRPSNAPALVQHLAYIKHHLKSCSDCQSSLVPALLAAPALVLTTRGLLPVSPPPPLHFPKSLGNPLGDLALLLPSLQWNLIHDSYLAPHHPAAPSTAAASTGASWRSFFLQLGATDFCTLSTATSSITTPASPWHGLSVPPNRAATVRDTTSADLVDMVSRVARTGDLNELCRLMEAIDQLWTTTFADRTHLLLELAPDSSEPPPVYRAQWAAAWLVDLRTRSWVPCESGHVRPPPEVFVATPRLKAVLGPHVEYLHPGVRVRNADLLSALHMTSEVSTRCVLAHLRSWRACGVFTTSLAHMTAVYRLLFHHPLASHPLPAASSPVAAPAVGETIASGSAVDACAGDVHGHVDDDVLHFLRREEWVFVPLDDPHTRLLATTASYPVPGTFRRAADGLCWRDAIGLFPSIPEARTAAKVSVLADLYDASLEHPFVRIAHVRPAPSFEQYCAALEEVARRRSVQDASGIVLDVLAMWGRQLVAGEASQLGTEWERRLRSLRVLPTTHGNWLSASDGVLVNDDPQLARSLSAVGARPLPLLCLPASGLTSATHKLLSALGVQLLSASVVRDPIPYGTQFGGPLEDTVRLCMPFAQRFIFWRFPDTYRALIDDDIKRRVERLCVCVCSELFVSVLLPQLDLRTPREPTPCLLHDNILYVARSSCHSLASIFAEVSRLFFGGAVNHDLCNLLHVLTIVSDKAADLDAHLHATQNIPPLPPTEEPWHMSGSEITLGAAQHALLPDPSAPPSPPATPDDRLASVAGDQEPPERRRGWRRGPAAAVWPPPAPRDPSASTRVFHDTPGASHHTATSPHGSMDREEIEGAGGRERWSRGSSCRQSSGTPHTGTRHSAAAQSSTLPSSAPRPASEAPWRDAAAAWDADAVAAEDLQHAAARHAVGGLHAVPYTYPAVPARPSRGNGHDQHDQQRPADLHPSAAQAGGRFADADAVGRRWRREAWAGSQDVEDGPAYWEWYRGGQGNLPVHVARDIHLINLDADVARPTPLQATYTDRSSGSEDAMAVGKFGERVVFEYLQRTVGEGVTVRWVNEDMEQGAEYDLVIETRTSKADMALSSQHAERDGAQARVAGGGEGEGQCGVEVTYVEVKTTQTDDRRMFELSARQLAFAQRHRDRYEIYRVYGAGTADLKGLRIVRFVNPAQLWERDIIKLVMVV